MNASTLTSRSVSGNRPISFDERLKEIGMFFTGRDDVHKTLRRLMKRLEKADIPFALMGAGNFVSNTSVIAPGVLFDEMELERTQEDLPKLPIVPAPPLG